LILLEDIANQGPQHVFPGAEVVLQGTQFHTAGAGQGSHSEAPVALIRNNLDSVLQYLSLPITHHKVVPTFDMSGDMLEHVF
jgi:hypothetical protein